MHRNLASEHLFTTTHERGPNISTRHSYSRLASVGILLPATNRILMATFREISAVIPVQLTVSIVATIIRCGPFESVSIEF